jgi:hypothetical protein
MIYGELTAAEKNERCDKAVGWSFEAKTWGVTFEGKFLSLYRGRGVYLLKC